MIIKDDTVWEIAGGDFSTVTDSPYSFAKKDIGNTITGEQLCDLLPDYFSPDLENLLRNPPKLQGFYLIKSIISNGGVEIEGDLPKVESSNKSDAMK